MKKGGIYGHIYKNSYDWTMFLTIGPNTENLKKLQVEYNDL